MVRLVFGYPRSFIDSAEKVFLNGIGINLAGEDQEGGVSYVNVFVDDPLPGGERVVVVSQ